MMIIVTYWVTKNWLNQLFHGKTKKKLVFTVKNCGMHSMHTYTEVEPCVY